MNNHTEAQRDPEPSDPRRPLIVINSRKLGSKLAVGLVAVGLLAIGIGWYGAAGAGGRVNGVTDLRAQIPWLLSGGAFGLALVTLGAAMMIVDAIRGLRDKIDTSPGPRALNDVKMEPQFSVAPSHSQPRYVAGASSYHRNDCRLVAGRANHIAITLEEASERGLKPCRICEPERVSLNGMSRESTSH